MEDMGMILFGNAFRDLKVLVTGHTGFKGSWLTLWLTELGARVAGYAHDPTSDPNHWSLLELAVDDRRGDIRDVGALREVFNDVQPEVVFHLAAQPLVRQSYRDPLATWATNVMGTANVLEVCRGCPAVRAVLVATTDKVYENREWPWGYRETDRLGGHDAYSASKACSELLAASYRAAFFEHRILLATVRAGNVIGGGDWSEDRLIPDLVKAHYSGRRIELRSPHATRPWQHVLECLCGYLNVAQRLLQREVPAATAWNFGPGPEDNRQVIEVLRGFRIHWPELAWDFDKTPQPHEANLLYLDNSKAKRYLGWQPVWKLDKCLESTAVWYEGLYKKGDVLSRAQLFEYIQAARDAKLEWAQ